MTQNVDLERQQLIEQVIQIAAKKYKANALSNAKSFIAQFYSGVAAEDLRTHTLDELFYEAAEMLEFMQKREPSESKLFILNPDVDTHGFKSHHTLLMVLAKDMPFLVDTLRMTLARHNLNIHLLIHSGGMSVVRDKNGKLEEILSPEAENTKAIIEAPICFETDKIADKETLAALEHDLLRAISDVQAAVVDWEKMREEVRKAIVHLNSRRNSLDKKELDESIDFLTWLENNHFTFLGMRHYQLTGEGDKRAMELVKNTGLGVLRDDSHSKTHHYFSEMTPEVRAFLDSSRILSISKTNTKSTVHRPAYTDYIGVKFFDEKGEMVSELRIVGLYTSDAYHSNPKHIPFLREKVSGVLRSAGFPLKSHTTKVMLNILETLPRDDLFQASVEELTELTIGIFNLQERRRIRLFVRRDIFGKFMSCLVYVPRDRFNSHLRSVIQSILEKSFNATESAFSTYFSESVLVRVHFVIRLESKEIKPYDVKDIEMQLRIAGRNWEDDLAENLVDFFGEEKGSDLFRIYGNIFPAAYHDNFPAAQAVYDIVQLEELRAGKKLRMNLYRASNALAGEINFKIFLPNVTTHLSDALPILENMGLRVISENAYELKLADGKIFWINDFSMTYPKQVDLGIDAIKNTFHNAFRRIWFKDAESDALNRLVLEVGLGWREVRILRGYGKYLRQIKFTYSENYIHETLTKYPQIAAQLVELFKARFEPTSHDERLQKQIEKKILSDMVNVERLEEETILKRYLDLIKATLRTNYYQMVDENNVKSYLCFKFACEQIPDLPKPHPLYEIFVFSTRFEGVHLRSSKVARGGIRWSDRHEDFRTEVLGLMKAQRVKNAVIVPSGAKGGFVPKRLPLNGTREAIMEEGIACYKTFISALLDVTDNYSGSTTIPPKDVVCYDDADPYLVVAADKGTATFSDIANQVAASYQFWLDDAFASGGSAGYDHKKMGITAKGAWESVKRHFREMDKDIQTSLFTVVGIGDMAGDVFGNGMLLSRKIQLLAAFNHIHIFVDPEPDAEKSFIERERLFNLPRSSWEDYNPQLISEGGGVFNRNAKAIKVSAQMRRVFRIKKAVVTPDELIQHILVAKVDLLWNGGIGTYVKSEKETNADVGDRANDNLRVNGRDLNCRVVGEGGNLGFTQLGRVEFALNGGRIFTDFVDNSGGVNCSDLEVNIKILLNELMNKKELTRENRNKLLAEMQDDVGRLVIRNNYRQTESIDIMALSAPSNVILHNRYIEFLVENAKLDRELEFLPDKKTLLERKAKGLGLMTPEMAVLVSYGKILLKERLLASSAPEDKYLEQVLALAFPKLLNEKYHKAMQHHRLRREIIATQLSNYIVNEMGPTFTYRLQDETGASADAIAKAYVISRQCFCVGELWHDLDELDLKVDAIQLLKIKSDMIRLIRRATRWFLRNYSHQLDIELQINQYKDKVQTLIAALPSLLIGEDKVQMEQRVLELTEANVPQALALKVSAHKAMFSILDVLEAARKNKFAFMDVAKVYFLLAHRLELGWVREQVTMHPVDNHWAALARENLRDDLDAEQRQLTVAVLNEKTEEEDPEALIARWLGDHVHLLNRWKSILLELRAVDSPDFVMFSVSLRELSMLIRRSILEKC